MTPETSSKLRSENLVVVESVLGLEIRDALVFDDSVTLYLSEGVSLIFDLVTRASDGKRFLRAWTVT